MHLNLLVHIDNFRWNDINIDRSSNIDNLALVLDVVSENEDVCWQHPDAYTLCYEDWGCLHELMSFEDFNSVKELVGWMKHRNFKTLLKFWQRANNYQSPYNNFTDFNDNHPEKKNGLIGFENTAGIAEFVHDEKSRNDLLIQYCIRNNRLINWAKYNHPFLPNIYFSNLYLADKTKKLSDSNKTKKEIMELSKFYCDKGYIEDCENGAKIANADSVGTEVARRNFYSYEAAISREEEKLRGGSMRKIFSVSKDNEKMYLSIDFEKGNAFEWCNYKGEHLGEFRFNGEENGSNTRDDSGEHNIWAISKK